MSKLVYILFLLFITILCIVSATHMKHVAEKLDEENHVEQLDTDNISSTTRRSRTTHKRTLAPKSKLEQGKYSESAPHGNPRGGVPFNDATDLKLSTMTPCIGVELFWYPDYLFALRFIYADQASNVKTYHGDPTSRVPALLNETFMLKNGERINKVTSYVGKHIWSVGDELIPFVLGIQFETTNGRTSQLYGSSEGEKRVSSYAGYTFGYAKGRSVLLIDELQIVWKNQEILKVDEGKQFIALCPDLPETSILTILSAVYQTKSSPSSKSKDVTSTVRDICGRQKSCSFLVKPKVLKANLCHSCQKQLYVTYTCSNQQTDILGPTIQNTDSMGNNIDIDDENSISNVQSIEDCGRRCLKQTKCVGVVFNAKDNRCFLKNAMVGLSPKNGASSMVVFRHNRNL